MDHYYRFYPKVQRPSYKDISYPISDCYRNPSITIFIPTYNRGKMLEKCFASIEQQDLSPTNFECFIVDDASHPYYNDQQIIKDFINKHPDWNIRAVLLKETKTFSDHFSYNIVHRNALGVIDLILQADARMINRDYLSGLTKHFLAYNPHDKLYIGVHVLEDKDDNDPVSPMMDDYGVEYGFEEALNKYGYGLRKIHEHMDICHEAGSSKRIESVQMIHGQYEYLVDSSADGEMPIGEVYNEFALRDKIGCKFFVDHDLKLLLVRYSPDPKYGRGIPYPGKGNIIPWEKRMAWHYTDDGKDYGLLVPDSYEYVRTQRMIDLNLGDKLDQYGRM